MPKAAGLKRAEFATIQRRLVKLGAGAPKGLTMFAPN